jgi:hypothetical protein
LVELEADHDRTRRFLAQHGRSIKDINELREGGALIAVVDDIGGFFSIENRGLEGQFSSSFQDPKRFYYAQLDERGTLENPQFEFFSATGGYGWSMRNSVDEYTIGKGVFEVTSEELINRINGVFADQQKEIR